VTRLPEPTLVLPTVRGRLTQPRPRPAGLVGYRPSPLRAPVRRRTLATSARALEPAPAPPAALTAGLTGPDDAASLLGMPADILRRFATTRPHLLPRFQLVGGEPWFRPEDLSAVRDAR
jgi:hypothetical protein